MKNRPGPAPLVAVASAVAFLVWSWLALSTPYLSGLDALTPPAVDPASPWGQVLAATAVLTTPIVVYVALAALTFWALRRRLSNLAWAIGLSIPLTIGTYQVLKLFLRRPRPDAAAPLITAEGWAYPSGHMTALTVLAAFLVGIMVLTRRRRLAIVALGFGMAAVWVFVFYNRLALRAHHVTDLFAGGFLGAFVASAALAVAGVRIRLPEAKPEAGTGHEGPPRAAMIINPVKIPDPVIFRRHVEGECAERGYELVLWLETRSDEPGAEAANFARDNEVDLVFVAGGDGTVRTVCASLAGSGIPIAILPVGTGNLLARNLAIPLDLAEALNAAFDGDARDLDLVVIRPDGGDEDFSMVMAGMGADATIMSETNTDLKKVVGPAAYAVAALAAVNKPPFEASICIDDNEAIERQPAMVLVANVGQLVGNITLSPDAVPHDGLLDVLVASPKTAGDWAKMTQSVLVGAADADGVERAQAHRVVVETAEPVPYQIDGDALGTCQRLEASLRPGAVRVMMLQR